MFSVVKVFQARPSYQLACYYKNLIIATTDGEVQLYNDHQMVKQAKQHRLGVVSMSLHKDVLVTNSIDQLIIWDLPSLQVKESYPKVKAWCVGYYDGVMFSSSYEGVLTRKHQDQEQTVKLPHEGFVMSLKCNHEHLTVGTNKGKVYHYDHSLKLLFTFAAHQSIVRALAYSPDGKLVITGSDEGRIAVYDSDFGDCMVQLTIPNKQAWILSIDVHADGVHFATSSSDGVVRLWSLNSRSCIHTFDSVQQAVWRVTFNEDGTQLAYVDNSGKIYVCSTKFV